MIKINRNYFDGYKQLLFGLLCSIILSVSLAGVSESHAYEISFEPTGYVLKQNPMICAIEPSSYNNLEPWQIERFMEESKTSSDEWESKLKQNQKNSEIWEITYVERLSTDDNSDCDITINFEPKAKDKRFEHGLLGLAEYDPINDYYNIIIYYLQGKLCYNSERIGDIIWYWYEPCFSDDIRISKDLGITIRHEIGHAFGLGHYQADDDEVTATWAKGHAPSPSIMVKFHLENFDNQQIRDDDIKKIHHIYGDNGFQSFTNNNDFDKFRAQVFLEKELYSELDDFSDEYLQTSSDNENALTFKGLALWELDRYDESISYMDEVLLINPDNQEALYAKGKWLKKSDNFAEALEIIDRVLELNPNHYKALSYKGLILKEMESYEEADSFYRSSFEVNPFNKTNLLRWGNLMSDFAYYEDAIKLYAKALEVDPNYKSALKGIGNALFNLEEYEEAINYYDRILKINPHNVIVLTSKGDALTELGKDDEAKEYYEKAEDTRSKEQTLDDSLDTSEQSVEKEDDSPLDVPVDKTDTVGQEEKPDLILVPEWIKINAGWWANNSIDDNTFVSGIQYLIKEGIISVSSSSTSGNTTQEIPSWIKNNADWWSQGMISDDDFLKGIEFLVENGIISVT